MVWMARVELATTRFQSEDSDQTELHPDNKKCGVLPPL